MPSSRRWQNMDPEPRVREGGVLAKGQKNNNVLPNFDGGSGH
jgi:hypothetical protein